MPPSLDTSHADDLEAESNEWQSDFRVHVFAAIFVGVLLYIAVESAANAISIQHFLAGLSTPSKRIAAPWNFDAGITDADVVAVVVGLLVLVAALNVALATLLISNGKSVSQSARAFSWAATIAITGRVAGAASLGATLTRAPGSIGLLVVLFALTALTIVVGGSMSPNVGEDQLLLKALLGKRQAEGLRDSLRAVTRIAAGRSGTTPAERSFFGSAARLVGAAIVYGFVISTAAILTISLANLQSVATADIQEWMVVVLRFLVPLGSLLTFAEIIFLGIQVAWVYASVRKWPNRRRVLLWLYWVMAVGWMILLAIPHFASADLSTILQFIELGVLPPLLPWAFRAIARKWFLGPGKSVYQFVACSLREQLRVAESDVASYPRVP